MDQQDVGQPLIALNRWAVELLQLLLAERAHLRPWCVEAFGTPVGVTGLVGIIRFRTTQAKKEKRTVDRPLCKR
jgi:hypothetical protein